MGVRKSRSERTEGFAADVKKDTGPLTRLFVERGQERRTDPYTRMTESEAALLGLDQDRRQYHRREVDIEAVRKQYSSQSSMLFWLLTVMTALFVNAFWWIFLY